SVRAIDHPAQGAFEPGLIDLVPCSGLDRAAHRFGRSDASCGQAAYMAVVKAVELVQAGQAEAICTAPLAKASLQAAGHPYPGHTELLGRLTGTPRPVMVLAGPKLKVALVTTHLALKEVPGRLSQDKIVQTACLAREFLVRLGLDRPRLAVCGLNPHAGEGGLFGDEDIKLVAPAVEQGRKMGLDLSGPEPPDTVFVRAAGGRFDLVVALYHDQGLIPLKLLHFKEAVNVTLGLPLIRTSVGHGTAFDRAGQGRADPASLKAALRMAAALARPEQGVAVWA
ncbi:MAG: 4-hydroxythreonine-4-phosphate dehydrogenase PdxA, partial [Deltaproteobacteria bacterium]|nr:4-hydroxythreonine-4-phosphate dehydrogenase PdxA [Deltaproteobacteria bacterium]